MAARRVKSRPLPDRPAVPDPKIAAKLARNVVVIGAMELASTPPGEGVLAGSALAAFEYIIAHLHTDTPAALVRCRRTIPFMVAIPTSLFD